MAGRSTICGDIEHFELWKWNLCSVCCFAKGGAIISIAIYGNLRLYIYRSRFISFNNIIIKILIKKNTIIIIHNSGKEIRRALHTILMHTSFLWGLLAVIVIFALWVSVIREENFTTSIRVVLDINTW